MTRETLLIEIALTLLSGALGIAFGLLVIKMFRKYD